MISFVVRCTLLVKIHSHRYPMLSSPKPFLQFRPLPPPFHLIIPSTPEQAIFLPTFGAVVSEALARRESEKERRFMEEAAET